MAVEAVRVSGAALPIVDMGAKEPGYSGAANRRRHASGRDLREPDSGHVGLVHEAVEPPLQFPQSGQMIFQLREATFAGEKRVLEIGEFGAARRVGLALFDLREEGHYGTARLRNADSKSFGFTLGLGDRAMHGTLDEREPPFRGCAVALRRAKAEPAEAKHYALPNNRR
jgi:hypothetical protein